MDALSEETEAEAEGETDGETETERAAEAETETERAAEAETEAETDSALLGKPNKAADKSAGHYSKTINDDKLVDSIDLCCQLLWTFSGNKFNAYAFVQKYANAGKHPAAIHAALYAVLKQYQTRKGFKNGPQALAVWKLKQENGNFNEADFIEAAEKLKAMQPPKELAGLINKVIGG